VQLTPEKSSNFEFKKLKMQIPTKDNGVTTEIAFE
jgi:hypothetical protein